MYIMMISFKYGRLVGKEVVMWFIVVVRQIDSNEVFSHISYAINKEQAIILVKEDFHPDERKFLLVTDVFNTGITTPIRESI